MIYLLMGVLSGIISGMGMGGGTLLIPMLTIWGGLAQLQAQAVNLAAYLPAALLAVWRHKKAGLLDLKAAKTVCLWGLLGAAAGVAAALLVPEQWLRRGFGGFLLLLGIWQLVLGEKRNKKGDGA